jgi:S1-C subfamily serine protease
MKHFALLVAVTLSGSVPAAAAMSDAFFASLQDLHRQAKSGIDALKYLDAKNRPQLSREEQEQIDLFETSRLAVVAIRVQGATGSGAGTGFIVAPDGLLVTAAHVVAQSAGNTVSITTATRGRKKARILAVSTVRDIALLQIEDAFNDWPAFDIRQPATSATGALVYAIGNPLDSGIAFSRGAVSNIRQTENSPWMDFIQADIMINPGNSGGVLVDTSGRLLGMNTSVARSPQIDGLAYAVPAADIQRAVLEYRSTGRLVDSCTTLSLEPTALTVLSSKPLHHLNAGDAIVSFPGSDALDPRKRRFELYRLFGHARPGETVAVEVTRAVTTKIVTSPGAARTPAAELSIAFNPATGLAFAAPSPELETFLNAVTASSVELLEYHGHYYSVEPIAEPSPKTGLLLRIKDGSGWTPTAASHERVVLPVEELPARNADPAQA